MIICNIFHSQKKEKVGVAIRKQQKYTHTSGSKSFARKHQEMVCPKNVLYCSIIDHFSLLNSSI